ncbi:hypothetical protein ACFPVT_02180 [Corynebacterium choanae]|uniref:Ferrienterobactin-binding periplasmic protein n=1 Tax=Corynebacterium choanae TaxID=1862358 RepID=A0A3G6J4F1_9CORY|nr:hypothetical protein [Corynebacterium choanae]AZA12955.1 Ferrienterobactin-binding periplasmic protein precursor [Corynebacterium choanae]
MHQKRFTRSHRFAVVAAATTAALLASCSQNTVEGPSVEERASVAASKAEAAAKSAAEEARVKSEQRRQESGFGQSWPRTIGTLSPTGERIEVTLDAQPTRIIALGGETLAALLADGAPVVAIVTGEGEQLNRDVEQQAAAANTEILTAADRGKAAADTAADVVITTAQFAAANTPLVEEVAGDRPLIIADAEGASWQNLMTTVANPAGKITEATSAVADFHQLVGTTAAGVVSPAAPIVAVAPTTGGFTVLGEDDPMIALLRDVKFELPENTGEGRIVDAAALVNTAKHGTILLLAPNGEVDAALRDEVNAVDNEEERPTIAALAVDPIGANLFSSQRLLEELSAQFGAQ